MATLTQPTLQSLLTSVRTMLKQPSAQNSFWTDAELVDYIDEATRLYFLECVEANEGYFTVQTGGSIPDLDIVVNTETVALPADCFQVKNLWKSVSQGYVILGYRNNLTSGYSTQGGTSSESFFPSYYFQGNNLVLRDTPNFSQVGGLRLEYIQFPDNMIYGGDTLTNQISPVFKQLLVMYAVYKAKLSESMVNGVNVYAVAKTNVDELYQIFKQTIVRRSKNPTYVESFNPEIES